MQVSLFKAMQMETSEGIMQINSQVTFIYKALHSNKQENHIQ